jgi:hypothetical protein
VSDLVAIQLKGIVPDQLKAVSALVATLIISRRLVVDVFDAELKTLSSFFSSKFYGGVQEVPGNGVVEIRAYRFPPPTIC